MPQWQRLGGKKNQDMCHTCNQSLPSNSLLGEIFRKSAKVNAKINGQPVKRGDNRGTAVFGEQTARDHFTAQGHKFVGYKHLQCRGFDIVTFKDGKVYFIDNKAYAKRGNINDVSALTRNFGCNKAIFEHVLTNAISSGALPPSSRAHYEKVLNASKNNRYVKVVTNAVFSPDEINKTGISQKLRNQGIFFINLRK